MGIENKYLGDSLPSCCPVAISFHRARKERSRGGLVAWHDYTLYTLLHNTFSQFFNGEFNEHHAQRKDNPSINNATP